MNTDERAGRPKRSVTGAQSQGIAAESQHGGIKTLADPILHQLAQTTQDTC